MRGRRAKPIWKPLLSRLHRDEGGNVLIIYVGASLLLVGMVWAIIGSGARVVQHETIQSSADAAAFSASVIKAKGLNIIAFCNLVMALLLALVMLLRLIKYALIALSVALAICAAMIFSPVTAGLCASIEPDVASFTEEYSQLESRAETFIKAAMNGLHYTERAVAKVTPALALVEAYHIGTDKAYKTNFGSGDLVTVAWPLLEPLPVKDGTCQDLAKAAKDDIDQLIDLLLGKLLGILHVPSPITGLVGGAIKAVLSPVANMLCGGGSVSLPELKASSDCSTCENAANIVVSTWHGKQVWRNSDMPQDQWKGSNPGSINHMVDGTCSMQTMPSWSCPGSGSTIGSSMVSCDSDSSGKQWQGMVFEGCKYKDTQQETVQSSNWPLPLVFTDDWQKHVDTRAYTILTNSNMDARRSSVDVATPASKREGAPLPVAAMMAMAEAEWTAWNNHPDLWHMDWRARLVPFTFGDTSDTNTTGATGVPSGAAGLVSKVLSDFGGKSGMSGLQNQFLLH